MQEVKKADLAELAEMVANGTLRPTIGLQLVGKRRGDIELLEISMALEAIFARNPHLKRSIPNL